MRYTCDRCGEPTDNIEIKYAPSGRPYQIRLCDKCKKEREEEKAKFLKQKYGK